MGVTLGSRLGKGVQVAVAGNQMITAVGLAGGV